MYYFASSTRNSKDKIKCVSKLFIHTEEQFGDTACTRRLFCDRSNICVQGFRPFNWTINKVR
jgi:hypothetical protein